MEFSPILLFYDSFSARLDVPLGFWNEVKHSLLCSRILLISSWTLELHLHSQQSEIRDGAYFHNGAGKKKSGENSA